MGGVDPVVSLIVVAVFAVVTSAAAPLYVFRRAAVARELAAQACSCRDRVPVYLQLPGLTGIHVSDVCPGCGRTIYMASWVFHGR
jgi:hypothetical protein